MPFDTVLVHAEPGWGSSDAITAALSMAVPFKSHIIGVGAEAFDLPNYAFVEGGLVQLIRDQVDEDLDAARLRFTTAVAQNPGGSTFVSGMEAPCVLMGRYARGADLIVTRRVPTTLSRTNLCNPADLFSEAGIPVVIAPAGAPAFDGRRIVVAWKDCREARRALADAMPFLLRAEQVHLVAARPTAEHAEARVEMRELVERLGRHGVGAEVHVIAPHRGSASQAIEIAADRLGAGMIVVGAYGQSRFREWVLGGVTQDLVDESRHYVFFSR